MSRINPAYNSYINLNRLSRKNTIEISASTTSGLLTRREMPKVKSKQTTVNSFSNYVNLIREKRAELKNGV